MKLFCYPSERMPVKEPVLVYHYCCKKKNYCILGELKTAHIYYLTIL